MKDLILEQSKRKKVLTVEAEISELGYLYLEAEDNNLNESACIYLSIEQVTQLRDHLTEALNKLK